MATPFSQRTPTGLLIAQTVGITASAYLLGQNASLSFISIPAIMQAPAPLAAKQWEKVLTVGGQFGIPLALISAASLGYVTSQRKYPPSHTSWILANSGSDDSSSTAFKLNLAASILLPSIIPFTLAFIAPINRKLHEKVSSLAKASLTDKAVEAGVASGETTHALLDKWATLNLGRAGLIAVGAICAIIAAVDKTENVAFRGVGLRSGANRF